VWSGLVMAWLWSGVERLVGHGACACAFVCMCVCVQDAVRAVALHPSRLLVASGSDDCCVKLWLLPSLAADKPGVVKKAPTAVAEPMRTLRGHVAPVLSCAIVADVAFSAPKVCAREGACLVETWGARGGGGWGGGRRSTAPVAVCTS
jgi:hypothetical protein